MKYNVLLVIILFTTLVSGLLEIPCPNDISQSSLWERTHLEPCSNNEVNLFIEDPWSQSLLHACGSENRGALPTTCSDIRFRSLAVDSEREHIYVSSTYAILRGNLAKRESIDGSSSGKVSIATSTKVTAEKNMESIVGGFVVINIRGYNLGKSTNDIKVSVKGKECDTTNHYNDTYLTCIIGNPNTLLSPISHDDISISMVGVGRPVKGVLSKETAHARLSAGYQQPLIYEANIIDKGFRPGSITVHIPSVSDEVSVESGSRLYWYNRASNSIQSSDLNGQDMYEHATGFGRIADIKVDTSGNYLFLSNQHLRNVMVLDVSTRSVTNSIDDHHSTDSSTISKDQFQKSGIVVAQDISEPWGLALDENNGLLFVAESGKGRILRYEGLRAFMKQLDSLRDQINIQSQSSLSDNSYNALTLPKPLSKVRGIVSVNVGVQLTDIALFGSSLDSSAKQQAKFNMKQNLSWNELNGDKVKVSTLHGTRIENIVSTPNQNNINRGNALLWPRSIVGDTRKDKSHLVYVAEFLGKIWELSINDPKHRRLIVDLSGLEDLREEETAIAATSRRQVSRSDELDARFLTAPSSSANLREFLENAWRSGGDYSTGQTRTGALLRCTA